MDFMYWKEISVVALIAAALYSVRLIAGRGVR
jgi:hypothetical protein